MASFLLSHSVYTGSNNLADVFIALCLQYVTMKDAECQKVGRCDVDYGRPNFVDT